MGKVLKRLAKTIFCATYCEIESHFTLVLGPIFHWIGSMVPYVDNTSHSESYVG